MRGGVRGCCGDGFRCYGGEVKHIVCFSGGKDSTALVLWAKENLPEFTTVFCDTGWEHPITYAYVEEINQTVLGGKLVRVKSEKYPQGMVQLCVERKGIPSTKRRFCTQELKVYPLHAYFESLDDEVTSYQGVRADESASRAAMTEEQWLDDAGGYWIRRPLLRWTAEQCFAMMAKHEVKPNPLYLLGSSRVGCWPCIMTGLGELKRIIQFFPDLKQRLIELERTVTEANPVSETRKWPSTFFKAGTIPARFCSISGLNEQGEMAFVPTAEDVFRYIESVDENQIPMFPARSCMSVYNLCE
jgi:3'-phosphoadenosine 5'-phosphosulfate sulfotransferase (PAPS reductase)/FAD synthetase